ncbi:MAG: class I SAM-dependent methyltransferase [bacterium]
MKRVDNQKEHFMRPEIKRFYWQTQNSYILKKEKELISVIAEQEARVALEIGCGEGANMVNLQSMGYKASFFGVDFSPGKIEFCKSHSLKGTNFICADALCLPFLENTFDMVFCRDLLHHVKEKEKCVNEMVRVVKPKGKVIIIEGNGKKFTNFVFSLLFSGESGMKNSTPKKIEGLLKGCKAVKPIDFIMKEPSNLFRVLLHYGFGIPELAKIGLFVRLLDFINRLSKILVSEEGWAYIIVVCEK